jgi:hypothetical protein
MFAIMSDFTFPPNEVCSSLVNWESLYGTWTQRVPAAARSLLSTRAAITICKDTSDLLISTDSLSLAPVVVVCLGDFSLPARSTRLRVPDRTIE